MNGLSRARVCRDVLQQLLSGLALAPSSERRAAVAEALPLLLGTYKTLLASLGPVPDMDSVLATTDKVSAAARGGDLHSYLNAASAVHPFSAGYQILSGLLSSPDEVFSKLVVSRMELVMADLDIRLCSGLLAEAADAAAASGDTAKCNRLTQQAHSMDGLHDMALPSIIAAFIADSGKHVSNVSLKNVMSLPVAQAMLHSRAAPTIADGLAVQLSLVIFVS